MNHMTMTPSKSKFKKIISTILVQNEDDDLDRCLSHLEGFTDGAVIIDNASTNPKTQKILNKHKNFIKDLFRNPKYEKNELKNREKLLQMALAQNPDWIISVNADEIFEEKMAETVQNLANPMNTSIEGYYFPIYSLWKSEKEYRADGDWKKKLGIYMFKNKKILSGKIRIYDFLSHISFIPKELGLNKVYGSNIRVKNYCHLEKAASLNDEKFAFRYWNEDKSKIPTISLCMILKNETDTLRKCLETSKGLWDELIVAWSGDNPETKEILEEFGAKIIPYVWKDDFADARNTSIKHATKDWILWLDGDDYIDKEIITELKHMLMNVDNAAVFLMTKSIDKNSKITSCNCLIRFFRNHVGCYFKGRIHEDIILPNGHHGLGSPFIIWHSGYEDQEKLIGKIERNIKISLKEISEDPSSFMSCLNLGISYLQIEKWDNAIASLSEYLEKDKQPNPLKSEVLVSLAKAYLEKNEFHNAIKAGYEALAYNNLLAEPYMVIGAAYSRNNQVDNAILVFETILKLKEPIFETNTFFPDNYSIRPRLALAKLYLVKGAKEISRKYLKEILKMQPANKEAKEMLKSI